MLPDPALLVGAIGLAVLHHRGHTGADGAGHDGRAGTRGAGTRRPPAPATWRFAAGLLLGLLALSPALERAAATSFAWHMGQHQLLTLASAPLLASSATLGPLWAAVTGRPPRWRPPGEPGTRALVAGGAYLAVVLTWHLPVAYDAALADPHLHLLEHATLLGAGVLLWSAVLAAARDDRHLGGGVVALAFTAIVGAGLGVVLLTASSPLYGAYAGVEGALLHQRVGGALMKVGALLVHAGAAVWVTLRWLHRLEAPDRAQRATWRDSRAASETSTIRGAAPRTGA